MKNFTVLKSFFAVAVLACSLCSAANATDSFDWANGHCFQFDQNGNTKKLLPRNVCENLIPSHLEWRNGLCFRVDPTGVAIGTVDTSICELGAASHVEWQNGKCFLVRPDGIVVKPTENSACGKPL